MTPTKFLHFREDLRSGMSINEACSKYHCSFEEAFKNMSNHRRKPKRVKKVKKVKNPIQYTPKKYIGCLETGSGDKYYTIRKSIKGTTKVFGTYCSLDDALRVRDELIRIGWKQRSVDAICERLGVERRKGHHNHKVRYS